MSWILILGGTLDEKKPTAFTCRCKNGAIASEWPRLVSLKSEEHPTGVCYQLFLLMFLQFAGKFDVALSVLNGEQFNLVGGRWCIKVKITFSLLTS